MYFVALAVSPACANVAEKSLHARIVRDANPSWASRLQLPQNPLSTLSSLRVVVVVKGGGGYVMVVGVCGGGGGGGGGGGDDMRW